MTKYRIKEIIRTTFENDIGKQNYSYKIESTCLFLWNDYVFKECNDINEHESLIFLNKYKEFNTEKEAADAINTIENLYYGKYKGYRIQQTYNGIYFCYWLGRNNVYGDHYYNVYKSLKDIQNAIDTYVYKEKIRYIYK